MARDRLTDAADLVRAEGGSWVDVVPRATHSELHLFQRARRERRKPSKAEVKRIAKLEAEQQALQDRLDDEETDVSDEDARALQEELGALGDHLDGIDQSLTVYAADVMAQAGAVITVDHAGAIVVLRGLLRSEQAEKLRAKERDAVRSVGGDAGPNASSPAKAGVSEKLVRRLSAHRTAALQAEVARHRHEPADTAIPLAGEMQVDLVPQGTLIERIRAAGAGLGDVLTPTGVGTTVETGKQVLTVAGRQYLVEVALRADFALVGAFLAAPASSPTRSGSERARHNGNAVV